MISTQLNPAWLDASTYIAFLNRGFDSGWDRASYDFFIRRPLAGKATDVMVRAEGTTVLAGVSFCYRQLCVGVDPPLDVCIMSAGTTLRSERGRGHYAELLRSGVELCRANRCAAILGFVTRENTSGRGLQRLGAYPIPSFYIASSERRAAWHRARRKMLRPLDPRAIEPRCRDEEALNGIRFRYPQRGDWRQQFVQRPNPVRALRLAHDCAAVIEAVGETDRLQWLGCPPRKTVASIAVLAASSAAAGRTFFMYTLDPLLAAASQRLGLHLRSGLLMLLPLDRTRADWAKIAAAPWHLQSGDRL